MNRKNMMGHTVCFGILATAAAAMLMANTVAFAAGPGEESTEILREDDRIFGTVTDVSSDSITVSVLGDRARFGFGRGLSGEEDQMELHDGQTPPELPDGQTPPERPEGEQRDGQTPPEFLNGQTPPERPEGGQRDGQTPPELPDGQIPPERPEDGQRDGQTPPELLNGQTPPELPEGRGDFSISDQLGSEVTITVDDNTVITKGTDAESASISDVAVGSMVVIQLDGDTAVSIMIFS